MGPSKSLLAQQAMLSSCLSRFYTPKHIQLRNEGTGYYIDPEETARRVIKVLACHERVQAQDITLESTFADLGIDPLTKVELFLGLEREFSLEFPDEDVERIYRVRDAVEWIAKSFYAD